LGVTYLLKLINLSDYPIDQPSGKLSKVIDRVRADLEKDGCAIIRGFLSKEGVSELIKETTDVAHLAHHSSALTNAYFTADDPSLPKSHPKRQFFERSNAFIPADNFAKSGALRSIFDHEGFDEFIRACLNEPKDKFFRYADPLADAIVNVSTEGYGFPWHFDTNNYTVTLAIQNATEGGEFEYAPMIRHKDENFTEVSKVLKDQSQMVKSVVLQPGDLQLFKGRYSLHRVAPLKGSVPRYVAILSYVEEENMVGSVERTKQLYGRVLPIHYERAGQRADNFID
jgi:hypothetical protein|tara:strand:+ start:387 stop:1238 length:852 start_codon:yes stop_codon:yes gene_type:complete